jgi:DNA-binding LacI/PurR family transcriptional regulator
MKTRRTNVTAFDVARLAEVSQSAVSRAFTPGAAVAESTRQRILEAAKKLGYRPNAIARSLITNRSRIIGVVVSYFDNQFYPLVLELLSKELQLRGYHLLLFCTDSGDADNLMHEILQYQVDGIVMASTTFSSPLARSCSEAGIPVVLFNRTARNSPSSTVASDNIAGGRLVADLLCAAGHRRIAYIAGLEDTSTSRDREQGFFAGPRRTRPALLRPNRWRLPGRRCRAGGARDVLPTARTGRRLRRQRPYGHGGHGYAPPASEAAHSGRCVGRRIR